MDVTGRTQRHRTGAATNLATNPMMVLTCGANRRATLRLPIS